MGGLVAGDAVDDTAALSSSSSSIISSSSSSSDRGMTGICGAQMASNNGPDKIGIRKKHLFDMYLIMTITECTTIGGEV
jgi:hypothetical protein